MSFVQFPQQDANPISALPVAFTNEHLAHRLAETVQVVRNHWRHAPQVGIVLGSGLGHFVEAVRVEAIIPYEELPHFPCSTAVGHAGRLVCGWLGEMPVMVMQGRCHLYEGHAWDEVTYPLQLFHACGIRTLILSCAAGGLAEDLHVGDLLVLEDHVNFNMHRAAVPHWLQASAGSKKIYSEQLVERLVQSAHELKIPARRGVYIGVTGPNYETRAEQRFFAKLGDAIGMSTIPEAIVGQRLGMRTCALATITNLCRPDHPEAASGDHVIQAAARTEPRFRKLVTHLVECLSRKG
ncbi:purine-nucleoside phosphorylase [Planctomicrobium piriforme]|uniref:Purine nucleoside phosphorylase n=1 Tax=Planctomicrobium piriforme TaxID=1576369 RepID=A0A1I3RJ77_9PLAN|nr:purine-nucleoside phosphorylase [Planctomicrobium piriforme]SFJ46318.1 purine-nucleoside phosphorylase [Planctomicrobium piriforme]